MAGELSQMYNAHQGDITLASLRVCYGGAGCYELYMADRESKQEAACFSRAQSVWCEYVCCMKCMYNIYVYGRVCRYNYR